MTELPADVVDEAARLTQLARAAVDEAEAEAYRADRDATLDDHGFRVRVRTDGSGPVLVCYPADWVEDGVVDPARIEDTGRAVERPLEGTGDDGDWAAVDAHNRDLVDAVAEAHGEVHGATAAAFADFMGNHYARRIDDAGPEECRAFLTEYLPRNAWPTEEQVAVAPSSVRLALEAADAPVPATLDVVDVRDDD